MRQPGWPRYFSERRVASNLLSRETLRNPIKRGSVMIHSLFLALAFSFPAKASIMDQALLLAPPSPRAQSQVQYEETYFPYTSRFTVGLGSGVNSFGGNIGRLYGASSPVLELRGEWAFHPAWSLRVGGDLARYSFSAQPNGSVNVKTETLRVSSQSHFLSTALSGGGWDPYLALSGEMVFRAQVFQRLNSVQKDSAAALGAGLGTNYIFAGGSLGLWAEAGASKIFFQDRFAGEYAESGIADQTGPLFTGRLGMKYFF
jgi:hypothetical protein